MARFFLTERGLASNDADVYVGNRPGTQDDTDTRHLHEANGHCVRALYFYCGIADLAAETGDTLLLDNLRDVFTDISRRKMYLTGGVGSTYRTESFTAAYDLPNRTAYSESCAAIALVLFATRMRQIDRNARYGDVAERVLYNALLSATSLTGDPSSTRTRWRSRSASTGARYRCRRTQGSTCRFRSGWRCSAAPAARPTSTAFSENSAASSPW